MTGISLKNPGTKAINIVASGLSSPHRPLPLNGIVNIDNISDKEYELINDIADATVMRKINWKSNSIVSILTGFISKKDPEMVYNAVYKNMKINVRRNLKGKVNIKITTQVTKQTILETFIPYKPEVKLTGRSGTSRAMLLNNMFNVIRFQVDGQPIAS